MEDIHEQDSPDNDTVRTIPSDIVHQLLLLVTGGDSGLGRGDFRGTTVGHYLPIKNIIL